MTDDSNEGRDLNPSSNCGCAPTPRVAVAAWLIKTPGGRSDEDFSIVDVGRIPDSYSNAPDDLLLITAQSGDRQAFVELCRRYSPMVKKKSFSIVKNKEDAEDALQDTLLQALKHVAVFRPQLQMFPVVHED